jgi:hypothetical protein
MSNVHIRNGKVNSAIEIMQLKHVILICSKLTLSEYACEKFGHSNSNNTKIYVGYKNCRTIYFCTICWDSYLHIIASDCLTNSEDC